MNLRLFVILLFHTIFNTALAGIISFSDPKVESICVTTWDTDRDGKLSEAEAAAVTDLGGVFQNTVISSFNELYYFTGLTRISPYAFSHSTLTSVKLPENVTSLDNYAFFDCVSLASITIPAKIHSIGQNALSGCTSMYSIAVDDGNTMFCSVDGVLFSKDKTTLLQFPAAKTNNNPHNQSGLPFYDNGTVITSGSEVLVNGVALFDNNSMESNETASYTVPYGTMIIGPDAFYKSKLESVSLPTSLRELNYNAFGYSTNLIELTIPEGVKTIRNNILDQCSNLKVLRIPSTVTNIGQQICNGCNAISDVYSKIESPFDIDSNCFSTSVYSNATLHVPEGTRSAYSSMNGWKEFKRIFDPSTKISFLDPKVKSICLTNWDANGDGELSISEAEDVTSLGTVFNGTKISSFHELLFFTGLTIISEGAFSGSSLTAITIPINVTALSNYAFFNCVSLESITIPSKVKSIGQNALSGCTSLYSITVEDGNTAFCTVDGVLFTKDKTTLLQFPIAKSTTYTVPDGTVVIGRDAFYKSNLASISLPTSLKELVYDAFGYCKELTELAIPEGVTTIGDYAVDHCANLKTLRIPSTVTNIGQRMCNGCNAINDVYCEIKSPFDINSNCFTTSVYSNATLHVPEGTWSAYFSVNGWKEFKRIFDPSKKISFSDPKVESICVTNWDTDRDGNLSEAEAAAVTDLGSAFRDSQISSFNELYFFTGLTSIAPNAFIHSTISSIILPTNVISIGDYAFLDCVSLESITIPSKVQSIGKSALSGCMSMHTITVEDGNTAFCTVDGVLFTKDKTTLLQFPIAKSTTYTVPDGTVVIGRDAFYKSNLASISLPTSLRELVYDAFGYCKELTELAIPEGVTTIGDYAVDHCANLKTLRIPSTVTNIGQRMCNGCKAITDVYCDIIQPFGINNNNFMAIVYAIATLHVSPNSVHAYESTEGWKEFIYINRSLDSFTSDKIRYGVISSETHKLEVLPGDYSGDITIPSTVQYHNIEWKVTRIANSAFSNCPQLITVSIPTTIEDCGVALFEASERLSAIIWQPHLQLTQSQIGEIMNHNLLFYVSANEYVPTNIDNVVVNNHANLIRLVENNEFYCPQQFVADKISFTHHYIMETGIGESKGWETIVLPFDVKRVTHSSKGEIVPFAAYSGGNNVHPFWLYGYDSVLGFVEATVIEANRPYIISMPNNPRYADEYILAGNVEFSADNVIVKSSADMQSVTHGDNRFCPTFQTTTKDVKALNVKNDYVNYTGGRNPGSAFIYGLREVRPFEAYMTSESGSFVSVAIFDDLPTAIGEIPEKDDYLCNRVTVYTTTGQVVRGVSNCTIEEALRSLAPGVYIINGRKMVVR